MLDKSVLTIEIITKSQLISAITCSGSELIYLFQGYALLRIEFYKYFSQLYFTK